MINIEAVKAEIARIDEDIKILQSSAQKLRDELVEKEIAMMPPYEIRTERGQHFLVHQKRDSYGPWLIDWVVNLSSLDPARIFKAFSEIR
jgi:hypothetical protein